MSDSEAPEEQVERPRRMLVIANQTCPCPAMHAEVAEIGGPGAEVLVVAPALNSRLAHWVSDTDGAVAGAEERLAAAVASMAAKGLESEGRVGDADPLQAMADALSGFAADEIVITTHPPGRSHWLEKNLLERARERYDIPVTHVLSEYGLEPEHGAAVAPPRRVA